MSSIVGCLQDSCGINLRPFHAGASPGQARSQADTKYRALFGGNLLYVVLLLYIIRKLAGFLYLIKRML